MDLKLSSLTLASRPWNYPASFNIRLYQTLLTFGSKEPNITWRTRVWHWVWEAQMATHCLWERCQSFLPRQKAYHHQLHAGAKFLLKMGRPLKRWTCLYVSHHSRYCQRRPNIIYNQLNEQNTEGLLSYRYRKQGHKRLTATKFCHGERKRAKVR